MKNCLFCECNQYDIKKDVLYCGKNHNKEYETLEGCNEYSEPTIEFQCENCNKKIPIDKVAIGFCSDDCLKESKDKGKKSSFEKLIEEAAFDSKEMEFLILEMEKDNID